MDLPFSLKLNFGYKSGEQEYELLFFQDEASLLEYTPVKVKEFSNLSFTFNSIDKHAKLYIPELDDYLIENQVKEENGDICYIPSDDNIIIYNRDQGKTVPLIPGYYTLYVKIGETIFYSRFEIILKDLGTPEWEKMKIEIEKMVGGLARTFIPKKTSRREITTSNYLMNDQLFQRILEFENNIPQAIVSLESLKKEAKYRIDKRYNWKPIGSKNLVDQKTISQLQIHPEKRGLLYTPSRIIKYDIIENQWIKFILSYFKNFSLLADRYLEKILQGIIEEKKREDKFTSAYSQSVQNYNTNSYNRKIENLKNNQQKIKHFYAYILEFLDTPVMKNISSRRPINVPKSLVMNPKYNTIYKMYLKSRNNRNTLNFSNRYQYYWKSTDVLYEIWCFIKIIRSLSLQGYTPISGWIFENDILSQELPFLHEDTTVVLSKNDIRINLVYNNSMKKEDFSNTLDIPVKTSSKRKKPDIRLDIILQDKYYIGSLIFEVKYKKLDNILDKDKGRQRQQLMAYKQNTMSSILAFPEILTRSLQAVSAVFALYPSNEGRKKTAPKYFEKEGIFFHLLNPSSDEKELSVKIQTSIEERISLFNQQSRN